MEGTHGQLSTGLTDRLRGHDARRLADVDELAGRHRAAVAHRTDPGTGGAGQHRPNLDRRDARGKQLLDRRVAQVMSTLHQHIAIGIHRVSGESPCVGGGFDVRIADQRCLAIGPSLLLRNNHVDATFGAAVVLADDDVLRDVDQTTGQVTRVRGTKRGVRQALTSAVRVDEVLENGQALTEGGLDRTRDVLTLRVGNQTLHAGQVAHLRHVSGSTGLGQQGDRVVGRVVLLQRLTDLVGGLLPDLDQRVATLLLVQSTTLVLLFDPLRFLLVAVQDLRLLRRHQHVGHRNRDT
ncbi:Uncharacterised protein [Mycobacteroides abscessus subsp. abscessus]|nr:Uncharacterised protein [Mycobacteroides abscessus subsp. abscessus]